MSMTVQGSFQLTGLINGDTFNGFLRVQGNPLLQVFTPGTDTVSPDFESMSADKQPTVVPVIRAASTGGVVVPQTYTWKYNGVELTFDGTTNLCTNSGMEGVFEKIASLQVTIDGDQYNLTALRVKKNLAAIGNYDNDRISFSGTIESGGNQITINEISTAVTIMEATGNSYYIQITASDESIDDENDTVTLTAHIYKSGIEVSDTSGYTFQWYKRGITDTAWGTSKTQVVTRDDVDSMLPVRCEVRLDGEVVGNGFTFVVDYTDPLYGRVDKTGISGNVVGPGDTATLTLVLVKRSTGATATGYTVTWTWHIRDNEGDDFTLTGKSGATFTGASCTVTYADIQRAGYGISGDFVGNVANA